MMMEQRGLASSEEKSLVSQMGAMDGALFLEAV